MRQKIVYIVVPFLLLCNLMFTQVIAGYLHTHEVEADWNAHKETETQVDTKEHCTICALHFNHELYHLEVTVFAFLNLFHSDYSFERIKSCHSFSLSPQGRAPPFTLS